MRTTDERLTSVKNRVKELEQQKKQQQYRYIGLLATVACLVSIVGIGIAMPSIIGGLSRREYANIGMMASIFYEGEALGYVLIGLLAFALGVCLTVLCFLLQPKKQKHKEEYNNDRNN